MLYKPLFLGKRPSATVLTTKEVSASDLKETSAEWHMGVKKLRKGVAVFVLSVRVVSFLCVRLCSFVFVLLPSAVR